MTDVYIGPITVRAFPTPELLVECDRNDTLNEHQMRELRDAIERALDEECVEVHP